MRYKRRERETVILYNEAEENASVCTFNRKLKKKLAKLASRFPDKVRLREVTAGGECVTYTLPKTCVTPAPQTVARALCPLSSQKPSYPPKSCAPRIGTFCPKTPSQSSCPGLSPSAHPPFSCQGDLQTPITVLLPLRM